MAGRGPAPKDPTTRINRVAPGRGEWQPSNPKGWQHGPIPKPPTGLTKPSRDAWKVWFGAWFASHWETEDLPGLRVVIRLYDAIERGQATSSERSEWRQLADTYGITPKGQQDRRWAAPKSDSDEAPVEDLSSSPYGHLRAVGD